MKLTDLYRDFGRIRSNRVVRNASALMIAQGANYLLPLASVPFLIHTLGATSYGILAFAQALIAFFSMVVGFGFGMNTTKEVAENHSDKTYIALLTASVLFAKLVFALVGLIVLLVLTALVPALSSHPFVFLSAYTGVAGGVFSVRWLFEGLQVMKPMAIIDVSTRAFGILLIFIFIRRPDQVALAAFLLFSGSIISAFAFSYYAVFKLSVPMVRPKISLAIEQVRESWVFFVSTAGSTLFNQGNVVILGFIMSPSAVGIYAAAEKVVKAAATVNLPIFQSVYPQAMRLIANDRSDFIRFAKRLLCIQPLILLLPSSLLLFGAYWIAHLVLGIDDPRAVIVIMILSALPLSQAFADVLGNIVMIAFGYKKQFMQMFLIVGVMNVCMLVLLTVWFGIVGAACSVVLTEVSLTLLRLRFVLNRRLLSDEASSAEQL